ncbi:MAG TPA: cob(I)yrinic acid a,c-diamide adenosyltransferase [Anaerolineae bacterium]|nr:cob(I)yrinic acid a,c-diamide adenosyltransferase [Anaerolineae bacterium]
MPRLTTIYTRKGDEGETALGGGQRVPKDSARVTAYGTVDELNSAIGVALACGLAPRLMETLPPIQNELFHLGSDLAFREEDKQTYRLPQIEERHVQKLEEIIDELNDVVGPLKNFILPGGSIGAAQLHVARTICRRAERAVLTLAREEPIGGLVMPYLNRLSDLLFVMARYENQQRGRAEPLWNSRL